MRRILRPISRRPLELRRRPSEAIEVDVLTLSRPHACHALGSPPGAMETSMRTTTTGPRPALEPTRLYAGDGGRIFCGALRCAGMSAFYAGRTISGLRVQVVTGRDREAWVRELGFAPRCEGCGQEMGA